MIAPKRPTSCKKWTGKPNSSDRSSWSKALHNEKLKGLSDMFYF